MMATGVLNLWMHHPTDTADGFTRLSTAHSGRFVLGIGVSHAASVDRIEPSRYHQPLAAMAAYLDALDTATPSKLTSARVLRHLATYLRLPNYTNNLRRLGFTDGDLACTGSDRLVDTLVAWGDEDTIAHRVYEHYDAGANHVCIQALTSDRDTFPRQTWRRLAPALIKAN
jgi:hypothetical protein